MEPRRSDDALLDALILAVEVSPTDTVLRLQLGRLLLGAGRTSDAIDQARAVLATAPDESDAVTLMLDAVDTFDWTAAERDLLR